MLSCVGVRVVLLRAMCWLIPVPRERNAKDASHTLSWSQLPKCQVRVRLNPTEGYPTWMYLVPGTCYLSWMLSRVGVRHVVLLRAMCWLIQVPRERSAKGAYCSYLLIMVPTTTRVPGTGVDGRAIHGPSYRCRRTWTCRNRHFQDYMQVPLMWPMPAVTVTSSLPRLHFSKFLDIILEKSALKSPSK